MLQSFFMFLAPQHQAIAVQPEDSAAQPRHGSGHGAGWIPRFKMIFTVAGNTLGICGLMAGAWFSLQLLEVLLVP